MNSLKVDGNRNNTILEVSGDDYLDLQSGEFQVESDYDFPTGQPVIYYRWNGDEVSGVVEVNDEDTITSFYVSEGVQLSGLDLDPHIESVTSGDFIPSTTKEITINGINFSPFTQLEISGDGNFVNTMYFDTPKQLRASITVNDIDGMYNLVAKNDQLHSADSGYNTIVVKSKTVVDLRTHDVELLSLDMTSGISVQQDATKGLSFTATSSSWNRGVKFGAYTWNRNDEITLEIIFTRATDVNFMAGIIGNTVSVSSISSAYYQQEIGMYHNNNKLTTMYGGGDVSSWSQSIGTTATFDADSYYKLKLGNSGSGTCSISEVDVDDWDDETLIHTWESDCDADDLILTPFVLPQAADGGYYITGFRY